MQPIPVAGGGAMNTVIDGGKAEAHTPWRRGGAGRGGEVRWGRDGRAVTKCGGGKAGGLLQPRVRLSD